MIGNTWEWTRDWWSEQAAQADPRKAKGACCTVSNPRGGKLKDSYDPAQPTVRSGARC
jgi:formylglycine-generating enzyme required for sulfatase activity